MSALSQPVEDEAVNLLIKRLSPRMRAIVRHFQIPDDDGEDLIQQTLLAFTYKRHSIHSPEQWFCGTLRNLCRVYWRDRARRLYTSIDSTLLEALSPPQQPIQRATEFVRDFNRVLADMPERCQKIIVLRYVFGYSAAEAAEALGYRPSSIYNVTQRCIASFARRLARRGLMEGKRIE